VFILGFGVWLQHPDKISKLLRSRPLLRLKYGDHTAKREEIFLSPFNPRGSQATM